MFRLDPSTGGVAEWAMPLGVTSGAFMADGNILMNHMHGPGIRSPAQGSLRMLDMAGMDGQERFDDSRCVSRGRLWTGTFHAALKQPLGHLDRIGPDGVIARRDDGIRMSNGIAWSADDRTMPCRDSWPGPIHADDPDRDDGAIGPRRVLAGPGAGGGHSDGCAMDAEDGLRVAESDSWRVARYAPDGRLDRTIAVPTRKPTSLRSGGGDLRTMDVTSRRSGPSARELAARPHVGALFPVHVDTPGLPERDRAGSA